MKRKKEVVAKHPAGKINLIYVHTYNPVVVDVTKPVINKSFFRQKKQRMFVCIHKTATTEYEIHNFPKYLAGSVQFVMHINRNKMGKKTKNNNSVLVSFCFFFKSQVSSFRIIFFTPIKQFHLRVFHKRYIY